MAFGLPDKPPPDYDFAESADDETCPNCNWDREPAALDPQAAFNEGVLLAVEVESAPFVAASSTTMSCYYWRCPQCKTPFTTEDESASQGAMS